jgi:hypothetical protein
VRSKGRIVFLFSEILLRISRWILAFWAKYLELIFSRISILNWARAKVVLESSKLSWDSCNIITKLAGLWNWSAWRPVLSVLSFVRWRPKIEYSCRLRFCELTFYYYFTFKAFRSFSNECPINIESKILSLYKHEI